jgi:hypothetical protein
MKTVDALAVLRQALAAEPLPRAARTWSGAGITILAPEDPEPLSDGFRPPPRIVVTAHSLELSWLFDSLGRAFFAEGRIDGNSKVEFFGRLGNAANRFQTLAPDSTARQLCEAVLFEAHEILAEMGHGTFSTLPIAPGRRIADDDVVEKKPQ